MLMVMEVMVMVMMVMVMVIILLPNPKQWIIVHSSDLMMIIRQSIYILSIITKEMGKLKTHSPLYCITDN